jgi:hypothetical protein
MADERCVVVNPTASSIDDINTELEDVPAYSYLETVNPLSDAEQGAVTAAGGLVMAYDTATDANKRLAGKILRLGKHPGVATS